MSVRYIGSKARVAEAIVDLAHDAARGRFVDAFCGTGSVAAVAARRGWRVTVNDSLPSAVALATGSVVARGNVPFTALGGYERAVETLNDLPARAGFMHRNYSPASASDGGAERRYFTAHNAARLDAFRAAVAGWARAGAIDQVEERLLLADLMAAANRVANIAGTYGAFLSKWTAGALRPVFIQPRHLPVEQVDLAASVLDVEDLKTTDDDVVYFDPPYTKRQYAAYYHVLETLTAGDEPEVDGVTGLRPWRGKASDFCYKRRALGALTSLVLSTRARTILLSYSDEGHVPREHLVNALREAGTVVVHDVKTLGRYRPNAAAAASGGSVREFVIEVRPIREDFVRAQSSPTPGVVFA